MADQPQNQKITFKDFAEQTLSTAEKGGSVDVPNTLAVIESFTKIPGGYLTPIVEELLVAPKEKQAALLKKLFRGLIEPAGVVIPPEAENLPQFRAASTRLESSLPIGSPSPLREKAYKDTQTVLRGREKWVREVVQQYNKTMTHAQIYGQNVTGESPRATISIEQAPADIKKQFTTNDQTPEAIIEAVPFIKDLAALPAEDQAIAFITSDRVATAIVETVLTTPLTDVQPFVDTFTSSVQVTETRHENILETARRVAVAQIVVSAPSIEMHTLRLGDFSKEPLSAAASIIGSIFPSAKEVIHEGAFEKFWAKTGASEKFIGKLTSAIGSELNQSVLDEIIRSGNNRMSQKSTSQSMFGGLFDVVTSVVADVPNEQATDYFKALYEKVLKEKTFSPQVKPEHIVAMSHLNAHPDNFLIIGAVTTNWTLVLKSATAPSGLGAATAIGVATAGTTQRAASGLISKWLGLLGLAGGGPVGGAITTFLTDVVLTKMLDLGGQVLSGLSSLAAGDWMTGKDIPMASFVAWLPIAIIGVLVLFFVLPSFLNFPSLRDDFRHTLLAINIQGVGGGGGDGTIVDCTQHQEDPVCTLTPCVGDCRWPTAGRLTQGPHASCGSHSSGTDADAIDIANSGTVPVYSVLDGTVTSVYTGCEDNTGSADPDKQFQTPDTGRCGGPTGEYVGYGNHVVISGVATNGKNYTIIYGHLSSDIQLKEGDPIHLRYPIGFMDQTGNSSGQHLHFGIMDQGSGITILDLVPYDTPEYQLLYNKSSGKGCNISCGECPAASVSP